MRPSPASSPVRPARLPVPDRSGVILLLVAAVGPWLLAACHQDDSDDTSPDRPPDSTADTGEAWFTDLEVEVAEAIPTVATVRWQTAEPARCRVAFGEAGEEPVLTPLEESPALEHEAVLVGLRQQREVQFELQAEADSGAHASGTSTFTTGQLPLGMPAFTLSADDATRSVGGFTLAPITTSTGGDWTTWLSIVDEDGEVRWAYAANAAPRMRLSPDGTGITYISELLDPESAQPSAGLVRVSWTGELLWSQPVEHAQRDFAILDDGDLAVLVQVTREVDGYSEPLVGDQIAIVSTAGAIRTIWDAFDHFEPGWCGIEPELDDWSHANYLTWSAEAGELLVVMRELGTVAAVDPGDGTQRWALSNTCGDYVGADDTPLLVNPHSVEPIPGGFLVFNQNEEPSGCSGAYEIAVDAQSGTASTVWAYPDPDCTHIYFMGNSQPLQNGNRLIGMQGQVSEVSPDGEVVHQLLNPVEQTFSYAERVTSLYPASGTH